MKGIERRYLDRLEVPDARVVYSAEENDKQVGSLADITKISVRFEVGRQFSPGDLISLEIIIPEKETISVRGHVVRTINSNGENPAFAAVQFLPFGSDDRYNSMENYSRLDALTQEYSQKVA